MQQLDEPTPVIDPMVPPNGRLARWRIYLLAMPVIAIISILVMSAVGPRLSTSLYQLVPGVAKTRTYAIVVNTLPPFLVGLACILGIAIWRGSGDTREVNSPRDSHLARSWPLYAAFLGLGVFLYLNRGAPDFGFVSQLFLWPCCAFLGGAAGDAIAAMIRPTRNEMKA